VVVRKNDHINDQRSIREMIRWRNDDMKRRIEISTQTPNPKPQPYDPNPGIRED
jgi:hypothetical protein